MASVEKKNTLLSSAALRPLRRRNPGTNSEFAFDPIGTIEEKRKIYRHWRTRGLEIKTRAPKEKLLAMKK